MTSYKTEQENFWSGEFGDDYITRNRGDFSIASNLALFSKILSKTHKVNSLIEFGANIGLNLQAIQFLLPEVKISAVEINSTAVKELEKMGGVTIENKSILDYLPQNKFDFTLIKGVLIHINPDYLSKVYEILHQSSNRYICVVEYYNPSPITVNYRGHQDRLFKRDFAGEMLDKFQELSLIDYGFIYHRDTNFPQDDLTWFLMEKS